jgi:hypothetical protein
VERDDETWRNARDLIARHGYAALSLAAGEVGKRLAAGQYRALVAWTRVALMVAVMLDGRARQSGRHARGELDWVLDKVMRELREAGH